MCKENKREHPLLHPVWVIHPLGEHTFLNFLDQLRLLHVVRHWVGGHVEQQEVLFLCGQHTLFHLRFNFDTDREEGKVLPGSWRVSPSHSSTDTSALEGSKSHPTDIQSKSAITKVDI